jgi:hypothetical protein
MKTRISMAVIAVFLCTVASHAQKSFISPSSSLPGTVEGKVSDWVSGVEGVKVVVEGTGGEFSAVTGSDGSYKVQVPIGTYSVRPALDDPAARDNFHRAKFFVGSGSTRIIDLSAYSGFDYCSPNGTRIVNLAGGSRPNYPEVFAPLYESVLIGTPTGSTEVLFEYCGKKTGKNSVKYKGAVVSYGEHTIYSNRVTYYPAHHLLKVNGKEIKLVTQDDTLAVPRLSVSFLKGDPFFDIPKKYTQSIKGGGPIGTGGQSFLIRVERGSPFTFSYEDRLKGITLKSDKNEPFFVKTIRPDVITINGFGTLMGLGLGPHNGKFKFSITLETRTRSLAQVTVEIPRLDNYRLSGTTAPDAITIKREREKDLFEVEEPSFQSNPPIETSANP